jgi:acyl carrier protein
LAQSSAICSGRAGKDKPAGAPCCCGEVGMAFSRQCKEIVVASKMTRTEILAKIRDVLADVVDDPSLQLSETTTADDVPEWDSINHVKLLIGLESDLGFRFETQEVSGLKNVGELADLVQRKL